MKYQILGILLCAPLIVIFAQEVDSSYGVWWEENQIYKTFKVELGKSYQLKGSGYYDFWFNGSRLPIIRNNNGDRLLHIPLDSTDNTQVYARQVQFLTNDLKLDQSDIAKTTEFNSTTFLVEKHFIFREYYNKETVGPELLLRNSLISKDESWGLKPTTYQQIPLQISKDTLVQQIDLRIKNLGYDNDLEIYLNNQLMGVLENFKPYEEINFQIDRQSGLSNSSTIIIKSKGGPQHKFSVVGLKLTGEVHSLPMGSFRINLDEEWLFIPCDSNDLGIKIMDRQDSLYYIPKRGNYGWGFYLKNHKADKVFTTLSQPVGIIDLDTVNEITFRDSELKKSEYLIIVAEEILKNADAVKKLEEYISFRRKSAGGGYSINWMNYENIYHQYGYGAKNYYTGLFNYFRKLKSLDLMPKIVWLIGKGYGQDYKDHSDHLIPSYGFPASDYLLVNQFNETNPSMVARLAVTNGTSLVEYLQKILDYETMKLSGDDPPNWRKEVLHIAGGKTVEELNENIAILKNAWHSDLNQKLGMKLASLNKPLMEGGPNNLYSELLNRLNRGIGIRVFLGHGGVTSTEIGLDNPDLLSMNGKYPLMMDLGCQTGAIFTNKKSLSEQFTLAQEGGAIGYIGSSGYGYSSSFSIYLEQFYRELSNNQANRTLGEIFLSATQTLRASNFYGSQILGQQLNFHGDPFIKLFNSQGPDYIFSKVTFGIESSSNEMVIKGKIINLGRLQEDVIELSIHASGIELNRDTVIIQGGEVEFQSSFSIPAKMAMDQKLVLITCRQIQGENKILEVDTVNNLALKEVFVISGMGDLKYPFNHSIIHREDFLGLIFEANYPGEYIVELDTSDQFFHPRKFIKSVNQTPTLVEIKMDANQLINNQRYYWRLNQNSPATFFYSEDKKGHFFFNHPNQFETLPAQQQSEEIALLIQAVVRTEDNQFRSRLFIDGLRIINAGIPVAFYVVVIEASTGLLLHSKRFEATKTNFQVPALISFLEKDIKENNVVSLFTFHHEGQSFNNAPMAKGENHLETLGGILRQEGAIAIDDFLLSKQVPYLIVYQKGKGVIEESVGNEKAEKTEALVRMEDWLDDNYSYKTNLFGPSEKWDSVHLSRDINELKLFGHKKGEKQEATANLHSSSLLNRSIGLKNYLSIQLDEPINDLEIEFFGHLGSENIYNIYLEQDSLVEGQSIEVTLNGLFSNSSIAASKLCLSILGEGIERDTCMELELPYAFSFQSYQVPLWDDLPHGNYQLVSDWNGYLDSVSFSIHPYYRFPEVYFLVNGEEQVPMQSFKSGKKIRIQVESRYNHLFFKYNPAMAVEVKLKDSNGHQRRIIDAWENIEINYDDGGLTIQLNGSIEVDRNGIYAIDIIPININGVLLESLKKTAVVDVFLPFGVEKINFFPNPFRSQNFGLSFYYWGDRLPDSFAVGLLDSHGNLIKEVDLVQNGRIHMGKNIIPIIFENVEDRESRMASVCFYYIKVNNTLLFSGKLINLN